MTSWTQAQAFCSHFDGLVLGTSVPSAESQIEVVISSICSRIRDTKETQSDPFDTATELCEATSAWFHAVIRRDQLARNLHEFEEYLEYRSSNVGIL